MLKIEPTIAAGLTPEQTKLKKAAQEFEAMFLRYLLSKMRETVPKDGLIEDSQAMETYQDMLDGALADNISEDSKFGLADMLYKQLSTNINKAPATPLSIPVEPKTDKTK